MTDQRPVQLRRTIHADREGILAFLDEAAEGAGRNSDAQGITRTLSSHYRGYREGVMFARNAIRDLEPEFGCFPVQVRFAHPDAGEPEDQEAAQRRGLIEGEIYKIRTMVSGSTGSHITLHAAAGYFNPAMFEPVWPHESDADEPEYKVAESGA